VCVCACVCVYVPTYIYIPVYKQICRYICVFVSAHTDACTHIHTHMLQPAGLSLCGVCKIVCAHTYTYTHNIHTYATRRHSRYRRWGVCVCVKKPPRDVSLFGVGFARSLTHTPLSNRRELFENHVGVCVGGSHGGEGVRECIPINGRSHEWFLARVYFR